MIAVTEYITAMMARHLQERRQDPDGEPEAEDSGLNLTVELPCDPQVRVRCCNNPYIPDRVELRGQLSRRRRRERYLGERHEVLRIDIGHAICCLLRRH